METKNGRAVLLTKGGEFVNVKNKGYSVGDKVNIILNTGRLCAMAASLLVACAGIGSYFIPTGYVSVDINPSLMMTLNPYNRVIDVQTFNDDARILLSKTDIKGKGAEESIEILIKASEEIGYINDNNRDVILEIVPGMIKPNMERIHHPNIELTNETADRETLRMAQDIGVSMAKVKAIEEYTEKNGGDIRSNAAKFNDKSAKEVRAIMRESHLSDKKQPEMPLQDFIMPQEPKNAAKPPKPQTNGVSDAKTSYHIKTNLFPVIEQETEKNIPDNQPSRNDYRPPEIPLGMEHPSPEMPPVQKEQEFQPAQTEPKPQDRTPFQGGGNPDKEPVHKDNVPPVNQNLPKDEKPQGDKEPDEQKREEDNSEIPESNPNDEINQGKEDLTDNPQTEKKPDISEPTADKPQHNPFEPKLDAPPQGKPHPSVPNREDIPLQSNPHPTEPKHEEAPMHNEPPNNDGNLPLNENMGGHNEHKEMP